MITVSFSYQATERIRWAYLKEMEEKANKQTTSDIYPLCASIQLFFFSDPSIIADISSEIFEKTSITVIWEIMCLGLYFPLLYIKIFNCLLVSFLKRHLASAFCTHVMLSCVLKPMLGAGSPVTSPEALFPHVPSRGLVFGGQRMLVSSPGLRLSAWQGADSSLYSRSQAGSQEPGVRAAKTVTFNVLYSKIYEHVSK